MTAAEKREAFIEGLSVSFQVFGMTDRAASHDSTRLANLIPFTDDEPATVGGIATNMQIMGLKVVLDPSIPDNVLLLRDQVTGFVLAQALGVKPPEPAAVKASAPQWTKGAGDWLTNGLWAINLATGEVGYEKSHFAWAAPDNIEQAKVLIDQFERDMKDLEVKK